MLFQRSRRLIKIIWVCWWFDLLSIFPTPTWLKPFRWPRKLLITWWQPRYDTGERLQKILLALGPVFIKLGQVLSTRRDIIPENIADALIILQDRVPPFSGKLALRRLEHIYGKPLNQIFKTISEQPLASASVAQVHSAQLLDGTEVVVKLLRPKINQQLKRDIAVMTTLSKLFEFLVPALKRFRPTALVQELASSLQGELNLLREAGNAAQLHKNFENSEQVYVPQVYWDYCREQALVLERIYGVPISDIDALKTAQVDLKYLAEMTMEVIYTQIFRDRFFHADMHPGNIFVDVSVPQKPKLIIVDFGIVGYLDRSDQHYLAANFLAFFRRDYRRVAELHAESNWIASTTDVNAFESAIRSVCEPIFGRPLNQVSLAQTLLRLFQIAHEFDIQIQPQLLLLQKTLLNVEGVCQTVYPELNLWNTVKPFFEKWMKQQVGVRGFAKRMRTQLPFISERLPELPNLLYQWLEEHAAEAKPSQAQQVIQTPTRSFKSRLKKVIGSALSIVGIAGIISISINMLHTHSSIWHTINHHPVGAIIIAIIALLFGLKLLSK